MATRKTKAGDPRKRRQRKGKAAASGVLTTVVSIIIAVIYLINGDLPGGSGDNASTSKYAGTAEEYRSALAELEVRGRAPMTGYDRDFFGTAWTDSVSVQFGNNGCDTRNDILRRDLSELQVREGTRECLIEKGTLQDPFSGEDIEFVRGRSTSGDVQIDHVVPLADAWQKGAQQWDEQTRKNFANDPDNLLAVKGSLNSQKGAADAATWLPPNRAFRCDYAKTIITVKDRYDVWVTQAEVKALSELLDTCPA